MSNRDNVGIQLRGLNNATVAVLCHHINGMEEVAATKEKIAHTVVMTTSGLAYEVQETVQEIERKAATYGSLKIQR